MKEKSTRKERERAARRELIIEMAEQIIDERGFESTTMDEIAERAEMGKGTLYLYFKSKIMLYLAISERGSRILNREMSNVFTQEMSGIEMIAELGQVYLRFTRQNPVYFNAFNYYESIIDSDDVAGSEEAIRCEVNAREAMTYIVRALQIGMQDGSISDSYEPKELGLIIWGASKGVVHLAFMKEKGQHFGVLQEVEFSLESIVNSFIQLIGKGMSKND
jgi:AcrR family transcriptional regulator